MYIYIYISKIGGVVSDISHTENPQVNSKSHEKNNKMVASKDKVLDSKAFGLPSAADPSLSKQNNGSQNTKQVDRQKTPTYKSTVDKDGVLVEANGNSTQSSSANDVKNNVKQQGHTKDSDVLNDLKKQALATVNTGHDDAKKQSYTTDSNIQNGNNKQAHSTNSNLQNAMKKQVHSTNSSNHSAEIPPHSGPFSVLVYTEHAQEAGKYGESTGKSTSSDSKSNTALQPENKSSAGVSASNPYTENQNVDSEDLGMPTDDNANKGQDTDVDGNIPSDDEDEEEERNSDHQGNFYTYCLIKNICILAVFFFFFFAYMLYTHTHTESLMLNVGSQLYILCTGAGPP